MAFIPYRQPGEDPKWDAVLERTGEELDHILAIHSVNPRSLGDHATLYRHTMAGPSPLSRIQREMLAVVTSRVNACHY